MEEQSRKPDPSPADESIVRRLGCIESYQIALQKLDQLRGIILACRYTLPARLVPHNAEHELISTFERAVARVVLEHPLLHVGLAGEDTNEPSWLRLENIDLRNHIEWRTVRGGADEFQKVFLDTSYEQVDSKFTGYQTTPGWKIKVVRQENAHFIEVLFIFNHTNLDGSSAKSFHKDLLQYLHDHPRMAKDKILLRDHVLTLPEYSTTTLCPPPESLVEFPVEPNAMSEFLKVEVETPTSNYPKRPEQAHWAPIKTTPFKTQFRSITVPNRRLSKLLRACRMHKTTLTGFLHAITLLSLVPLLESSDASAFGSLTAMDIRRFLPSNHPAYPWFKPDRAMSNYVTIASHIADENFVAAIRSKNSPQAPESIRLAVLANLMWSAARKVRRDLKAKLDQGTKNDMIGFSQAIGDWRSQLTKHTQRPRASSWVITNLGSMDRNPTISSSPSPTDANPLSRPGSTWSITRSQLLMSANVVSSAFDISMVTVKGGDLIINCSWQDCVVDVNLGEALVKGLEGWLKFTARYENGWLPAPEKARVLHRQSRPSDSARLRSDGNNNLFTREASPARRTDTSPHAASFLRTIALSVLYPLLFLLSRLVQQVEGRVPRDPVQRPTSWSYV